MSTTATTRSGDRVVRLVGILSIVAALVMIAAGATTWATVSAQLSAQNITVAEDAAFLAGDTVDGPFSAYAQAQIIDQHALDATGGKTYAELDREDPLREVAMNASFLRASLFTSVVAYGVAALVMGLGVLVGATGWALARLGRPAAAPVAARTPELPTAA